jgi:mono/diheme cytochrome c family protein
MFRIKKLFVVLVLGIMIFFESCSNSSRPNYQYFPNMYEPIGYKTYADSDAFSNGIEAQIPVLNSVARGWAPYDFPDTNEGYEEAKVSLKSPIEISEVNLSNGKELYGIYCAVCHGSKGDGQGILMTREKFLGIPSYKDREITPGSIYHVLMYGKNAMGSHAGQVNEIERWQIAQHVMQLRSNLIKK